MSAPIQGRWPPGTSAGTVCADERVAAFDDRLRGGRGRLDRSIPEVPGAHSQGRTRAEARENVIDALRGILELRFGEHASAPAADSESLELVIGA